MSPREWAAGIVIVRGVPTLMDDRVGEDWIAIPAIPSLLGMPWIQPRDKADTLVSDVPCVMMSAPNVSR